jgi:serpin B
MSGRNYLILIAVALTWLIVACTVGKEPATATDLQSAIQRETDPVVTPIIVGELVAGNNSFAFDLFHAVVQGESNLFFSPYSISTALAMAYAGARGETAEQMANVLHYTLPQARLHPAFNALDQHLFKTDDEEGVELVLANALWGQEEIGFRQEFLDLIAAHYGAGMRLVNFQSEAGRRAASERINQWANDATAGRISDLVDPRLFTALTRLVLTNAITFDGLWEYPFDDTNNANFTLLDGTTVIVPLMQRRAITAYASGESWQAAELSYQGEQHVQMLILLPAEGQFEEFVRELDAARVADIEAGMTPKELALYLPRFTYAAKLTLSDTLKDMGMPLAFSESEADFSGMIEIQPRLYISLILHQAYITVNELGTEAAAATVIEVEVGEENSLPEIMRVDRPFIFLIRDTEQGTILFLGCMVNPADTR